MSKTGSKKVISLVDKLRENRLGLLKYILRKQYKGSKVNKGNVCWRKNGKRKIEKTERDVIESGMWFR